MQANSGRDFWRDSPLAYHGGGLAAARRLFPAAPEPWLDLSTGINPRPYPVRNLSESVFWRLPEAEEISALEAEAGRFFGLGAGAQAVAAPGTQALIQLLPRLLPARRVAILDFTYAEHGRAWTASGAEVFRARTLDELVGADVAVVVNPNNPDGRLCTPADLTALAARMAAHGGVLVVDEAFADFTPRAQNVAPLPPAPGLVVLRSFGKTFGLAGLRLGFLLADADFAQKARTALGPWAVSGAAVALGRQAYADADWLAQSAARLRENGARLDAVLRDAGFEILGGTLLFRLARHADAGAVFGRLCAAGVLTRPFAEHPGWLRFGIPGDEADLARLARALADG